MSIKAVSIYGSKISERKIVKDSRRTLNELPFDTANASAAQGERLKKN